MKKTNQRILFNNFPSKIGLVLLLSIFGFSNYSICQNKTVSRNLDTNQRITQKKIVSNPQNPSSEAQFPLVVKKEFGEDQVTNENGYFSKQTAAVSKVDAFLSEVNRDCPQYTGGSYRETAIDCLNRTIYHKVPAHQYPECPLLSTAMKKNKCNPDMEYSNTFDPENFNPLKYHFMYFSPNSSFYRIDGTEYIIEIVPPKN